MAIRRYRPTGIVVKLPQDEVLMGQVRYALDLRDPSDQCDGTNLLRWKRKYGRLGTEQLKELKRLAQICF
jgi:putative transposase